MKTPDFELPAGVRGTLVWRDRRWQPWSRRLPAAMRALPWPAMLATLAIGVLLVTFQSVVRGVVQQAEVRHKFAAAHADAIWRCKTMPGRRARDECLAQVLDGPHDAATLQAQNAMLAPVTQASR